MKNKKVLIRISAVLILSIAFLFLIIIDPYKKEKDDVVALLGIHDRAFSPISKDDVLELFNNKTAVLYLGKIDKEYSKILETLYKSSLNSNIKNIYYLNIENEERILSYDNNTKEVIVKRESSLFYNELLNKLGSFTEIYSLYNIYNEPINSGYKTIYTPMVLFIKNGKVVYTHYVKDINMNDNELENLYNIYTNGFKKIG